MMILDRYLKYLCEVSALSGYIKLFITNKHSGFFLVDLTQCPVKHMLPEENSLEKKEEHSSFLVTQEAGHREDCWSYC